MNTDCNKYCANCIRMFDPKYCYYEECPYDYPSVELCEECNDKCGITGSLFEASCDNWKGKPHKNQTTQETQNERD